MIERAWNAVSAILLVVAAGFVWRNNYSAAFGIAALGACAWFLGYRAQLKAKLPKEDLDDEDVHYSDEED